MYMKWFFMACKYSSASNFSDRVRKILQLLCEFVISILQHNMVINTLKTR